MWFISQVQHPAAKMLVLASQQMEQEIGDGTNFVMVFAGALLEYAEDLLRMVCMINWYANTVSASHQEKTKICRIWIIIFLRWRPYVAVY